MAEPTSTTTAAGISLTVFAAGVLGPLAGPYVVIVLGSLAGAMWPLNMAKTGVWQGLLLLARCTLTAVFLTGLIASVIERYSGMPMNETLGSIAMLIGALGNGWRPVFTAFGSALGAFASKFAEEKK